MEEPKNAKTVKGLSIAVIVFAAIYLVGTVASLAMGMAGILVSIYAIIATLIALATGIMGMSSVADSSKVHTVFILSIVSAVLTIIAGALVVAILCIILAVFANKLEKDLESKDGQSQNPQDPMIQQ